MEIWKPIEEFDGAYSISSLGRIRSEERMIIVARSSGPYKRSVSEKILPAKIHTSGYLFYTFSTGGGSYQNRFIHALMLETFISPRPRGQQVRHLDGSKTNNVLSNLEWGTPKQNKADQHRHGTAFGKRTRKVFTKDLISKLRFDYVSGMNISAVARKHGLNRTSVADVVNYRTHRGFL